MFPQQEILNRQRPRRAFDERLPDGRTVQEAVAELSRGDAVPLGGDQLRTAPSDAVPLGGDNRPTTSSAVPLGGIERSSGQETRPSIVGGSRDLNPLTREAARIQTMIQNPTRQVSPEGSAGTPNPMSKKKAILLGLLHAGSMIRPGAGTAEALAALGTGGLIGAVKPGAIQDWDRRIEVEGAQGRLARQQKLGLGQAQVESEQAETRQRQAAPEIAMIEAERKARYDQDRLNIQRQAAEGRISIAEATQKLREMELEERKRHNLETENFNRTKPTSDTQAAQAAEGEAIASSTQEAAAALKTELDQHKGQLTENEKAITQKEALWNSQAAKIVAASGGETKMADALAQVQANDPDYVNGTYAQTVSNTKALRDAISTKEKEHRDMQGEIRKGSAKAARGFRRGGAAYSGRTMSTANLARYAKDKGISIEAAKAQVEAQGVRVQ